ncbi:hypothetical protein QTP70_019776 [Hemibagrus guttatus]|uniref:Uncharacterized protein n=1 Tax=Hemibagrus guttatus TaxID=175788 RepID=A0AAE0REP5_9TELE|nr:hypothetical protein QTP70_019776 [Hemibagrus guttatus]
MTQKQTTEVTKTQMRSKELSDQISAQFEEMHRFLKKKEEEIKKHLETQEQEAVTTMCKSTSAINERLMDGKELECIFQSALEIKQPDFFLQWWNDKGFLTTERMKIKNNVTPDIKYESRVKGLNVIPHSFFLGPYETHLQFFVWKAMLGAVKPVPELLSIKDPGDSYLKVSPGKTSVRQADRQSGYYKEYNPGVISEESFQSGKHYWELEVGNKLDWSIGVKSGVEKRSKKVKSKDPKDIYFELVNDKGYILSTNGKEFAIELGKKPSKIGLYLDCDRKQISFYDADIMTQICITNCNSAMPCSISLFPGVYLDGTNIDPVTVCSYELKSAHRLERTWNLIMEENYSNLQEFTEDSLSARGNKPILYTSQNGQAGILKRVDCMRRQMVIFLIVTLLISLCVNIALTVFLVKRKPSSPPSMESTEIPISDAQIESLKLSSLQERFSRLCSDYTALGKTCSTEVKQCMPCPDGWRHIKDKCYFFSNDKLDWIRSKQSCASMDSQLTILHTYEQHLALEKIARSLSGFDYYYWIGLSDIDEEGVWKWVDNTPVNKTYWNEWDKEPNNHQSGGLHGEDCAVLNSHSKSWYDVPCDHIYKHICEMDAIAVN